MHSMFTSLVSQKAFPISFNAQIWLKIMKRKYVSSSYTTFGMYQIFFLQIKMQYILLHAEQAQKKIAHNSFVYYSACTLLFYLWDSLLFYENQQNLHKYSTPHLYKSYLCFYIMHTHTLWTSKYQSCVPLSNMIKPLHKMFSRNPLKPHYYH